MVDEKPIDDELTAEELENLARGLRTKKTNKEVQKPVTRLEQGSTKPGEAPDESPPTFEVF